MNIFRGTGSFLKSLFLFLLFFIANKSFSQTSNNYTTAGSYTFTVPTGVTTIKVEAWGGGAGGNDAMNYGGGGGAFSGINSITVTTGDVINITVGAGGGPGENGGASYITINSSPTKNINAAGGTGKFGGAAGSIFGTTNWKGGDGGTSSSLGGGGGGGSAGRAGAGSNGDSTTSNSGGNGGAAGGGGGGAKGGNGGAKNKNGKIGVSPGGGGGEAGNGKTDGSGGDGTIIITFTASCTTTNDVWVGSSSTDWNNATNWCSGNIPTSTTNVYIPSGPTNQPKIRNNNDGNCKSIT
ncbi:MAG: hypothetical protein H3C36_15965, partial [Chitinophagaceae bacterium]|nr:hypothetical protein [Chitinophagaceae bacterium]